MAAQQKNGRFLVPASEYVPVYGPDGEPTGRSVPKHWTADMLPAGHSTKAPSKTRAKSDAGDAEA